jgi:hypothetical protein
MQSHFAHFRNERGSAAEGDRELVLGGLADAVRGNGDAVEAGSLKEDVCDFIQGDGIHNVAGGDGVGNWVAFGSDGERHESIFVFYADEESDEIGEIFRGDTAVLKMFQHLVINGIGILPDWGGHANRSFLEQHRGSEPSQRVRTNFSKQRKVSEPRQRGNLRRILDRIGSRTLRPGRWRVKMRSGEVAKDG